MGNLCGIAALGRSTTTMWIEFDWIARLLRAHGRVLPMSSLPLTIEADVQSAPNEPTTVIRGQSVLAATPAE